jgi:ferredoxin-NADP reductase
VALVKKYQSTVVNVENPIEDVHVVSFRSGDKQYKYLPGQFLHLALDPYDPSSAWPESRCFSMQTSEKNAHLSITYSVKGSFTKRMAAELKPGAEIWLKLPYGELFSKSHNKSKTVFIAGGTGVTPYLSLFSSENFSGYTRPVLYLGIREEKYNLYNDALGRASAINNSFVINLVNQAKDGMLDIDTILKDNGTDATYFISGPPVMIKSFKEYLLKNGASEDSVRTDDWE